MQFWIAIILGVADVIGFKRLEDGSTAQRTCGIVGPDVLAEDRRSGSCLGAEDQWTEQWFGEPLR